MALTSRCASGSPIGGVLTSDPAATLNEPGGLVVFARGTDNAIWPHLARSDQRRLECMVITGRKLDERSRSRTVIETAGSMSSREAPTTQSGPAGKQPPTATGLTGNPLVGY
jgi:hypothetical protein